MQTVRYPLRFVENKDVFEFNSVGINGVIKKRVQFELIDSGQLIYNLAFGDINAETDDLDDKIVSNNGDTDKVLATVVAAVDCFFDLRPEALLYATGSTKARTRLYQMGISKNLRIAQNKFWILGEKANGWEPFQTGTIYEAFLVRIKN